MTQNDFPAPHGNFGGKSDFGGKRDDFEPNRDRFFDDPSRKEQTLDDPVRAPSTRSDVSGCCLGCSGCGFVVFLSFVVVCLAVYYAAFQGKPLEIRPETTFITEPLKRDEKSVDYFAALRAERGAPIPKDENGFALLCETFGPAVVENSDPDTPPWLWKALCEELKLDPAAEPKRVYLGPVAVLAPEADRPLTVEKIEDHAKMMERIREHGEMLRQAAWIHATRWNDDEREKVKGWIEKHGGDLDIVAQALEKPTFRIPLVRETENTPLLVSLPRMTGFFREIAAGLQCRCRYRLQTGDNDGAWSDLKTLILLYRKSDGSIWIRAGFADQSDELFRCLLTEGNLSEELLRRMDDDLDGDLDDVPVHEAIFPTFNKERKDVLLTARYMVLDAISLASVAPDSFLDALFFPPDLPPTERQRIADLIKMIGVDMNIITKKTNGYFDLFVPAADADDPEIRRTLDRKSFVEAEKTAMRDIEEHIEEHLSKLFLVSSRSELIGDVIGDQILSTVVRYIADEYDQQERRVVYRTQIALERYKRKHGEYPLTTESLVPEFLPGVPVGGVDPETPVSYTPDENRSGYVLVQKRCTGFPFFETETAEEPVRIPYDPGNEAHENRVHGGPHGH